MRKYFLPIFSLLIVTISAHAQTQKGSQLIGGFLSLSTGNGNTTEYGIGPGSPNDVSSNKLSIFGIGPSYSYFLANNLDMGFNAGYNTQTLSSTDPAAGTDSEKQQGYNFSAYLRKYFLYENKVGFRVGPYAGYQYTKSTSGNPSSVTGVEESRNKEFSAGIGFDFVYFPTRKLGLAATLGSLGYTNVHNSDFDAGQLTNENKDHNFGLNLANSNLALSVFYSFGK